MKLNLKHSQVLILVLPLLLLACGNGDDNADVIPEETVPDTTFYRVTVNNLRMRDTPTLQGTTLTLLPEGITVKYWDEHSREKEQITLRGESTSDYWYLIKYGNNTGWVYGGALEKVNMSKGLDNFIVPGERVGPILAEDSEQSIINRIGGENVERGEYSIGEGEMITVTYVYPGTEKELILQWLEEDFANLHSIILAKASSPWKTAEGLQIGSTLKEVEKINGKPFQMSGFQWDYAGTTTTWQNGNLSGKIQIVFDEPARVHKSLIGDHAIASDDSRLHRANPKVREIKVLF